MLGVVDCVDDPPVWEVDDFRCCGCSGGACDVMTIEVVVAAVRNGIADEDDDVATIGCCRLFCAIVTVGGRDMNGFDCGC